MMTSSTYYSCTAVMMLMIALLSACSSTFTATAAASAVASTVRTGTDNNGSDEKTIPRQLQAMDFFDDDQDLCDNSADPMNGRPELGPCDFSRFPTCSGDEEICYNRKPSRDHFYPDNHQHMYYIQYDRVFCYPRDWGGCSSCSPGRYCSSEQRCILDEFEYPCAVWF